MSNLSKEELRNIAKEEISKQIMQNIDSALIFTYVKNLEEKNKALEKENRQLRQCNNNIYATTVDKDKIREIIEKYKYVKIPGMKEALEEIEKELLEEE